MTTKYPHKDDWKLNDQILSDAIKQIKKNFTVDCSHDIPYVAGYNKKGNTVYLDCELPEFMPLKGGKKLNVHAAIILHEVVEKSLIDVAGLPYQLSHQIALRIERDAVESSGVSWDEYNKWMEKWVKEIGSRKVYPNTPRGLDMTPYEDEHDHAMIEKMK